MVATVSGIEKVVLAKRKAPYWLPVFSELSMLATLEEEEELTLLTDEEDD
jgi:hypothetical protein